METIAFRMILNPGMAAEYRRRHDEIWPELAAQLKGAGVSNYRIFLDPETHHLFAILDRTSDHQMDALPATDVVKRWWAYMADIMATHPDNVPVQVELLPMFHLP
ncbi:L-rhamnose mutarotase [Methylobrevis pamukkalensis]|uniref:L-rhamnose mutarotase n=1 Tax=Methylobrevis pamukkalensis TaxID=1439726 RepID=A0A1E3GYM7_9HYPH|nr:L-rhamnose mutarotase [Methylobrevis pamukkalensis]ODN69160.1 L-rhamnose mutarotase [Methylobrevis pamukkalensis]